MISASCPSCDESTSVVRRGLNRNGTQRCLCNKCHKTFTLNPKPRRVSQEKRTLIENALAERISQRGIAGTLGVSRNTIIAVRKKGQSALSS
ncbi:MAG: IS1 family transposase [Fibrella sp.]|nr:IS1 family transposase [Armatimonadota bacterium]